MPYLLRQKGADGTQASHWHRNFVSGDNADTRRPQLEDINARLGDTHDIVRVTREQYKAIHDMVYADAIAAADAAEEQRQQDVAAAKSVLRSMLTNAGASGRIADELLRLL